MKLKNNFSEILRDGKKVKLIAALGIIGILLIFFSCFFPKEEKQEETPLPDQESMSEELTNRDYEARYRQTVEELVKSIDGAGDAHVLVTLESGIEYVYAQEESKTDDRMGDGGETKSSRNSVDQKTILVEDKNGYKTALLRTTMEPKVRGVVVACSGGGDVRVVERVTEAVKTALGISSTKVCVVKLEEQRQ